MVLFVDIGRFVNFHIFYIVSKDYRLNKELDFSTTFALEMPDLCNLSPNDVTFSVEIKVILCCILKLSRVIHLQLLVIRIRTYLTKHTYVASKRTCFTKGIASSGRTK